MMARLAPLALLRRLVYRLVMSLPDRFSVLRLRPEQRYDVAALRSPLLVDKAPVRLLIAPANFAGQGYAWARSAQRLPGVAAVNMAVVPSGDRFHFPADHAVDANAFKFAGQWSRRHRRAVIAQFTHVLIEAERPLLGRSAGFDVVREVEILRTAGIQVAFVSHGTDLRRPSRHAFDPWSPFGDPEDPWVQAREAGAIRNHAMLDQVGGEVFVPTPELLLDRPDATWLPIVVDPARWATQRPLLTEDRLRVVHAPTEVRVKGTDLIEPTLHALEAEGLIEYIAPVGLPSEEMPGLYASVDAVLDQFRLGIYATAAIEAMAAGRLVLGYLRDDVRAHVRAVVGREVPVVQATPESLESVLRDISLRREHYREVAASGPSFVQEIHDGTYSSRVLARFLGVSQGEEAS